MSGDPISLVQSLLAVALQPFAAYLSSSSLLWWPFLLTALLIALVAHGRRHGGPGLLTGFRRRFFSRAIWWHPSSKADYAYYVVNGLLFPFTVAPLVVAGATVGTAVQGGLALAFGPACTPLIGSGTARLLYTVLFFVAYDFGRFAAHSLQHAVPFLWAFHKVHHSAERLTPITSFRVHPVELFLDSAIPNVLTGIVSGFVWYLSAGRVGLYTFFGLHVGVAAYNAIGSLRHWHVWVSYGRVLDQWLISPAHHQIHHSRDDRHYGMNRGYALAVWDRLFGTLNVPQGEERLTFGLGDGSDGEWHCVKEMYLRPFREVRSRLAAPAASVPVPAPVQGRRRFLAVGLAAAGCALLRRRPASAGLPARSVFLEDLTWTEVRDAVASGMTVALIPTGGIEQNGPHMALGKHNLIVRHTAGEIARRLGNALVAPVIAYVPEGGFDPPQGHLKFPGTMGVSEATFAAMLRDTATSLALAGFKLICFVGDHGGSQPVQAQVAASLSQAWHARGVRVANLGRYYTANGQEDWLKAHGFTPSEIGTHAGLLDTAELLAVDPDGVRPGLMSRPRWPFGGTGVAGDPSRATPEVGRALIELKVAAGVAEIRELLGNEGARSGE